MKRSAFAALCGVSKQQISKYEGLGLVVVADGQVDAGVSLAALEGRLDEAKRQRALQVLGEAGVVESLEHQPHGGALLRRNAIEGAPARSAKAEKDEIERDLRRLEYGVKAGELVHVAAVQEQAAQAIAAMREAFANAKRDIAAELCARFDVAPEKVTAVARFLGDKFELPLSRFATIAAALAKEPGSAPHDARAEDAPGGPDHDQPAAA